MSEVTQISSKIDINYLTRALIKFNASDLHLKQGRPPIFRINGKLISAKMPPFTGDLLKQIITSMLNEKQMADLEVKRQVDFSFPVKDIGRFRCNVYYQRGSLSAAIRMIPTNIPSFAELQVPEVLKELVLRPRGLILLTGATGTGKSTTLAAMVQYVNENQPVHILTIEDPIEFTFRDMKASITQREVGSDTRNFKEGVIAGLRQDPDIIMIGEMRDAETIQAALTAAETGHLVVSTLHTNDAKSTIERIVDIFPPEFRSQIRIQLASTLVAVCTQQLVMRADGKGQLPACEVLVKSPVVEQFIISNELERIPEAMAGSNGYYKMQTMNQALERMVSEETILLEEALRVSPNPDDLKLRLSGVDRSEGYNVK